MSSYLESVPGELLAGVTCRCYLGTLPGEISRGDGRPHLGSYLGEASGVLYRGSYLKLLPGGGGVSWRPYQEGLLGGLYLKVTWGSDLKLYLGELSGSLTWG